jgi:hypothetical protein
LNGRLHKGRHLRWANDIVAIFFKNLGQQPIL